MKRLWQTWTIDKPAALGDWLWQVFVVELAALLDRLTLRRVIALIPVAIVILAYEHRIPIPPELMLLGDLLAYIDIFSALVLFGIFARTAAVIYIVRLAIRRTRGMLRRVPAVWRRLDLRHRRASDINRRKRHGRTRRDDDDLAVIPGMVWA
ncbi:hypothetical protein JQ553_09595 [Bradyrhizobium lablabi]|nr:hypothetical protein [Bradyrhizobium lablabi]